MIEFKFRPIHKNQTGLFCVSQTTFLSENSPDTGFIPA